MLKFVVGFFRKLIGLCDHQDVPIEFLYRGANGFGVPYICLVFRVKCSKCNREKISNCPENNQDFNKRYGTNIPESW